MLKIIILFLFYLSMKPKPKPKKKKTLSGTIYNLVSSFFLHLKVISPFKKISFIFFMSEKGKFLAINKCCKTSC